MKFLSAACLLLSLYCISMCVIVIFKQPVFNKYDWLLLAMCSTFTGSAIYKTGRVDNGRNRSKESTLP